MRQTLVYILLFFMLFINSFGQVKADKESIEKNNELELPLYNLYYLSKYITSKNLEADQIFQIYNSLISNSDLNLDQSNILLYTDPKEGQDELNPVGKFLNKKDVISNLVKSNIISTFENGKFDGYKKLHLIKDYNDLNKDYDNFKKLKENFELYSYNLIKINEYSKLDEKIIVNKDSLDDVILKLLIVNKPSYSNNDFKDLKKRMKGDSTEIDKYKKRVIDYAGKYVKIMTGSSDGIIGKPLDLEIKNTIREIQINSVVYSSEQRAATSSYKLPSESDMINAMAMFLAKRAKQETIIWFMDKIRENIKNPLIFEAFPETIRLIDNLADYKSPTFSVAWRIAIATDFVKMPTNLAKSAWVNTFIFDNNPQKAEILSTAVTFGYDFNRLISEKYNYRDIIRYFYTSPNYEKLKESPTADVKVLPQMENMNSVLKSSITILYILTNELFAVDEIDGKMHYRLLTYEEVNSLSKEQWIALGQLIQLKYPSTNPKFNDFFKFLYNSEKKELSKWIGNLLISLSQFDKVNKDFQQQGAIKTDNSNLTFYNVWQNSLQIIDNLDYTQYLSSSSKEKVVNSSKKYIDILKESTAIYEQIQNKNYPVAVQNTMKLIQKISVQNDSFIMASVKINNIPVEFTIDHINIKSNSAAYKIKPCFDKDQMNGVEISKNGEEIFPQVTFEYNKVQPFLRFVKSPKDEDTFKIIKSLDPSFNSTLIKISDSLDLDKFQTIALINLLGLYTGKGLDKEKFFATIHAYSNNNYLNIKENAGVEQIKNKYQDELMKLTSFFGDVLVAKNAEELAGVIDSHALPPTSYKLKRRVASSLDLNGYVGIQGSRILPNGVTSLEQQYTIGITAPLGIAWTWSTLKWSKPANFGLTFDIVDLGNIVNHYLVDTTDDNTEDVHFSEVFSPACSFMWSIRNSPFVVFASVKLLPLKTSHTLDPITNKNVEIDGKSFDATILSFGIKIDIPLVNLWSKVGTN